jgi:hypothetical protein
MILVDAAIWPWRGNVWAHLVSDTSYEELHRFARRLGLPRVAFQGDHYDVDAETRLAAVALGAAAVDPRELMRRLRDAGLRRRTDREALRWTVVHDAGTAGDAELVAALAALVGAGQAAAMLGELRLPDPAPSAAHGAPDLVVRVLERRGEVAVVVAVRDGSGPPLADVVVVR